MAAEGDTISWFTYTGAEGERIPQHVTHVLVHEFTTVVRERAFFGHPNIVEVICHDKVEKIAEGAFFRCPSLKRVIMPGVIIVEAMGFIHCDVLTDVECEKLERIEDGAFWKCRSLRSINLPSAEVLENSVFAECKALTDVKLGNKLEFCGRKVFKNCPSLERITIPLKKLIMTDNTFQGCVALEYVDLVEEVLLQEIIAALHLEEWRHDMNEEVDSIHLILPAASDGGWDANIDIEYEGEKTTTIRRWISSVLGKIDHYKAEHQCLLDEAATTFQLTLPAEIVRDNVLAFLALPSHTF